MCVIGICMFVCECVHDRSRIRTRDSLAPSPFPLSRLLGTMSRVLISVDGGVGEGAVSKLRYEERMEALRRESLAPSER